MSVLGVNNVPTDRSMKDIEKLLQSICGMESIRFVSAFSNIYTNDIAALIAQVSTKISVLNAKLKLLQEMANPRVRRHLSFTSSSYDVSPCWAATDAR